MEASFEWVDIDLVIPNPKNPRRDHSISTNEMQEIISSKGWEEGVTCYKKGQYYIILSGHRRWYAAKKIGSREIPLFIVTAPKNDAEELDRVGSVQGGQVDWSPYEWAKFTYDSWKNSNEIAYSELAKRLKVSEAQIGVRIRVYQYYPRTEIEDKLANGMYSLSMLDYISSWIKRLQKHQLSLFDSMGESFIRQQMLKKYENKCFNSQIASDKTFTELTSHQEAFKFLTDSNKKLQDCRIEISIMHQNKEKDYRQNSLKLSAAIDDIKKIDCRTKKEAEKILNKLEKLLSEINQKDEYLASYLKENSNYM